MFQNCRPISILTFFNVSVFVWLVLFHHVPRTIAGGSFDPFMDSNLFSINWEGPLDLNEEEVKILGDRHMIVTTNKDEKYECILPESKKTTKDSGDEYKGPSAEELIRPLLEQTQCSYRIESYWTYELCHGKHLKQYHETKEQGSQAKVQEYYLGFGNHRELKQDDAADTYSEHTETQKMLPVKELEGEELPYFEIIMSDGTKCDLTNTLRKTHVFYVCHNGGRGEMYELKESSTCVYEVLVLTAQLCKHPSYRPKRPPVTEVRCHAVIGSPLKPSELTKVERETQIFSRPGQDFVLSKKQPQTQIEKGDESQSEQYPRVKTIRKPVNVAQSSIPSSSAAQPPAQDGKLGAVTDKQTLRDFFKGHTCLRGGTGWWKHEICFGRYVKQYHMEQGKQMTDIFLGRWDQENHLEWLRQNPSKKPKDPLIRKYISLHYTNGQFCDLTKKSRICEVRLRCVTASKNPHAMMLSLIEPKPCEYIMTVESALFCSVLKEADEDGLFHFEKMDL